jgi:hypothetical protein
VGHISYGNRPMMVLGFTISIVLLIPSEFISLFIWHWAFDLHSNKPFDSRRQLIPHHFDLSTLCGWKLMLVDVWKSMKRQSQHQASHSITFADSYAVDSTEQSHDSNCDIDVEEVELYETTEAVKSLQCSLDEPKIYHQATNFRSQNDSIGTSTRRFSPNLWSIKHCLERVCCTG